MRIALAVLASLLFFPAASRAATVRVADNTTKVRPGDPLPAATSASIAAARNEYEAFQVVVRHAAGAAGNLALRSYAWSRPLTGPGGATIPAGNVRVFAEVMHDVWMQSGPDGATGPWPDALVPDVDDVVNQKRNAFTKWWSVVPGTNGTIYVEVHVPDDASLPAGDYTAALDLSFSDGSSASVPVTLTVWDFRLPSTSSLPSAFGMSIDSVCRAMNGTAYCNGRTDQTNAALPFARFLLDHRLSVAVVQSGPDGLGASCNLWADPPTCDWSGWDRTYAPLFDGTDPALHLAGARLTTIQYAWGSSFADPAALRQHRAWALHFRERGWFDRTFDYTCDEPPMTCSWADIPKRAAIVHGADPGFRTMVTTNLREAGANDATYLKDIDIIDPTLNHMSDKPGFPNFGNQRASYAPWTDPAAPQRRLWWYQACMAHGCGSGTQWDAYWGGWQADYMVDASGVKNRAMEWLSWLFRTQGELYYDTTRMLPTAFSDQSGFGGTGDGNLLYPGTAAQIGGTTGIPVASLRLKLIRDGMEDYEYLKLVGAGDPAFADAVVQSLFPAPSTYLAAGQARPTPAQLQAARVRLAQRILELQGKPPPRPALEAPLHASIAVDGALGEWSGVAAIALDPPSVGSDNTATARLAWDARNLYVAFSVTDGSIAVNRGGRDGEVWDGDGVEIMVDVSNGASAALTPSAFHVLVNVNGDVTDERGTAAGGWDRSWSSGAATRALRTAAGYDVEIALPWASLGVTPCLGTRIGVDVAVNDVDVAGAKPRSADWARLDRFAQPGRWGTLTLGGRIAGTTFAVPRAPGPVAVDGAAGEFAAAPFVDLSPALAAAGSDDRVTARLLWSDEGLHAAFDVDDPTLLVNAGGRDGNVWNGDGVELMLHLGAAAAALSASDFHVLANASGDVTDEQGSASGWSRAWNLPAGRVAVARKAAAGYVVEMTVPWSSLGVAAPAAGAVLGLDLAHNDVDRAGAAPVQVDWAGLTAFAQPARWRTARLEAAPACLAP
ncbi:MAG TPA: sugar-binding protein [Anaeromyxobacteraceae bacterium]|nr:sugar-binding protein [Anaeromyxobacteraceae bacterium]